MSEYCHCGSVRGMHLAYECATLRLTGTLKPWRSDDSAVVNLEQWQAVARGKR